MAQAKRKTKKKTEASLYLVCGGRVKDTEGENFVDLGAIETIGYFRGQAAALRAWQNASQRHVDDAFMKYLVVQLR